MFDEAVKSMQALGFSADEALVYCTLLDKSPLSGYALAQKTGIARSNIYSVLERLYQAGCVTIAYNGASEYAAIPYERMLEQRMHAMAESRTEAVKQTRAFLSGKKHNDIIRNIYCAQDVYSTLERCIMDATESVLMKLWSQDAAPLATALSLAAKRGVELHLVILGEYDSTAFPYFCYREMRCEERLRAVSAVFDQEKIVSGTLADEGSCFCVSSNNYCLRLSVTAALIFDLELAELYRGDNGSLRQNFGCDLETLRKRYR